MKGRDDMKIKEGNELVIRVHTHPHDGIRIRIRIIPAWNAYEALERKHGRTS